ncbi:MAG: FkbM family methyltransferase [Clostridia bacterium]|nr:FkbM family methyltransferase [Clostridia bacterium]
MVVSSSGNRNANPFSLNSKKTVEIEAETVDSVCNNRADYIKYDVEGSEKEVEL